MAAESDTSDTDDSIVNVVYELESESGTCKPETASVVED